jgi:cytochrome c-type biogenesis protein CcmF
VDLGAYRFTFDGTSPIEGPNYDAIQGRVRVTRNDREITVLLPERRSYWVQQQSLAEAALGVSWSRDLLATMGEELGQGAWSLRVQVRPLMRLLWLGAALMALGGLLAATDRRYRQKSRATEGEGALTPAAPPAPDAPPREATA